jgi:hypothetical protein
MRAISADEYDDAVRWAPSSCPLFAMGDRRSGRELLEQADADAVRPLWPRLLPYPVARDAEAAFPLLGAQAGVPTRSALRTTPAAQLPPAGPLPSCNCGVPSAPVHGGVASESFQVSARGQPIV